MVLRMWKCGKKPSPLRNAAVQTVGETYFFLGMAGMVIAGVLAIATVASGSTSGIFLFHLDRCDCLLTSSSQSSEDAGASCMYGEDRIEANIGWKSFVITKAVSTKGCIDDWEGESEIGSSFGTGIIKKATTNYGNGASISADASVGLFVVSAFVSIVMFKTIKMSFYGPGSIYSIGLHNITILCLLLSIGSGISITTFWGRIQGRLGDLDTSLAAVLYEATVYACREDWNDGEDDSDFCDSGPWSFRVPLYAGAMAIAHVSVMFLTSVLLLTKSAFVEGLLDGSVLSCGKLVTPRVVEYEQSVGKALAAGENPDYDDNNALYSGGSNMIRPYPLPSTSKKAKAQRVVAEAENTIVSPLRKMSTPNNSCPQSCSSASINSVESPKSSSSGEGPDREQRPPRTLNE